MASQAGEELIWTPQRVRRAGVSPCPAQCEIIQGLPPVLLATSGWPASFGFAQHPQPGPCLDDSFGAAALRSLTAWAARADAAMLASAGAATSARSAPMPQSGHMAGASRRAIGRINANSPHSLHR